MAASASPSTTASGTISHQLCTKNISSTYAATNQARIVAVLKYIVGQSRLGLPVCSKCASTRRRNSRINRSLLLNFNFGGPSACTAGAGVVVNASAFASTVYLLNIAASDN